MFFKRQKILVKHPVMESYFCRCSRKKGYQKGASFLLILLFILQIISGVYLFVPQPKQVDAASITWDFSSSSDYTFDNTKIEFSSGQAQLIAWYNTSWGRRKAITITGSTAGNQTNYQLKITVTYGSDMQADFDDIRFTSSDGTTLIDYYLESKTDSSTADFWVEIPSIPASPPPIMRSFSPKSKRFPQLQALRKSMPACIRSFPFTGGIRAR